MQRIKLLNIATKYRACFLQRISKDSTILELPRYHTHFAMVATAKVPFVPTDEKGTLKRPEAGYRSTVHKGGQYPPEGASLSIRCQASIKSLEEALQ